MLKILVVVVLLVLALVAAGVYFILWPLALQALAALTAVLQPAIENIREAVPALPPEISINDLLAAVPLLGQLGTEGLTLLTEVAEGGITPEEAQRVLDLLRQKLSAEELAQLKSLLNAVPQP
ncbi:MAG: hypothetical protein DDT21_00882 [Syntrophomonadaceae bacterium]|nr:hypothetical protein [Bacillota bacterium]